MALPNEPQGFAVNVFTREIHKRHARHALDLRRTTPGGLAGILHGQDPVLCEECFGAPKPERKGAKRFTPEPVKVIDKEPEPPETRPEDEESPQASGAAEDSADVEEPDGPPDKG